MSLIARRGRQYGARVSLSRLHRPHARVTRETLSSQERVYTRLEHRYVPACMFKTYHVGSSVLAGQSTAIPTSNTNVVFDCVVTLVGHENLDIATHRRLGVKLHAHRVSPTLLGYTWICRSRVHRSLTSAVDSTIRSES